MLIINFYKRDVSKNGRWWWIVTQPRCHLNAVIDCKLQIMHPLNQLLSLTTIENDSLPYPTEQLETLKKTKKPKKKDKVTDW